MAVFNVSYDLNRAGQNYPGLITELESSPGYCHYLKSTWLIYTHEDAEALSERLLTHIDQNDSLLVIRVTAEYQGWLPEDAWNWIREHVQ